MGVAVLAHDPSHSVHRTCIAKQQTINNSRTFSQFVACIFAACMSMPQLVAQFVSVGRKSDDGGHENESQATVGVQTAEPFW
jgi:hypothetical protein